MAELMTEAAKHVERAKEIWEGFVTLDEFSEEKSLNKYESRTVKTVLENTRMVMGASGNAIQENQLPLSESQLSKLSESQLTELAAKQNALNESQLAAGIQTPTNGVTGGNIQAQDHVLFSMIRRTLPKLLAFSVVGVQPMTGPTGLIFSLKSRYSGDGTGLEALTIASASKKADVNYAGGGSQTSYTSAEAEVLGSQEHVVVPVAGAALNPIVQTNPWKEMSFSIEKKEVFAREKALKATYSIELAQDLQAVHGLSADEELSYILTNEIVREIDRELIDVLFTQARPGYDSLDGATAATFKLNGVLDNLGARWGGEKIKALVYRINKEAHAIALATGRGAGNFIITSANVATALDMVMGLDLPSMGTGTKNTLDPNQGLFAGMLGSRYKVYIDPSLVTDQVLVGYTGTSAMDNGWYYCPYTPMQRYTAHGQDDFQPRIGYKTRYGMTNNPFSSGNAAENNYYRSFVVTGLS